MNAVIAAGIAQGRRPFPILGAIEHHEFAILFRYRRIKCPRRFEPLALRRNDRTARDSSPRPEWQLGLDGTGCRGHRKCEDHRNSEPFPVSRYSCHKIHPSFAIPCSRADRWCEIADGAPDPLFYPNSATNRRKPSAGTSNVSGTRAPFAVKLGRRPCAEGMAILAGRISAVGL